MRHYVSKEVECPFYSQEELSTIYCEGAIPGAISTKTIFRSNRDLILHKHNFCNNFHCSGNCPISRSCNAKY